MCDIWPPRYPNEIWWLGPVVKSFKDYSINVPHTVHHNSGGYSGKFSGLAFWTWASLGTEMGIQIHKLHAGNKGSEDIRNMRQGRGGRKDLEVIIILERNNLSGKKIGR